MNWSFLKLPGAGLEQSIDKYNIEYSPLRGSIDFLDPESICERDHIFFCMSVCMSANFAKLLLLLSYLKNWIMGHLKRPSMGDWAQVNRKWTGALRFLKSTEDPKTLRILSWLLAQHPIQMFNLFSRIRQYSERVKHNPSTWEFYKINWTLKR